MSKRDIWRRVNASACREAERFATAQSPIRYAPNATSQQKSAIENQRLRDGLCIHGKFPRLLAEKLSRGLGIKVQGCKRCA